MLSCSKSPGVDANTSLDIPRDVLMDKTKNDMESVGVIILYVIIII